MRGLLNILRVALTVILCMVLLANLWLLASRLLLHEALPKLFGYSQAIVLSGSMEPAFSAGDMLIFEEAPRYAVRDVVIFRQDDAFVTHRIVREENGGFVTQGDANNAADKALVEPSRIEGRMIAVIPGIGGLLTFLRTPLGLLILILGGILLIEGPNIAGAISRKRVR